MSPRRPSPRGNDTGDQYDYLFDDLPPPMDYAEFERELDNLLGAESSQVAGDQILGSSQPTSSHPDPTPESSNPVPCSQGVTLALPDVPILYSQHPPGSVPQENSNEDNASNYEAAEASSLGLGTSGFRGGDGILENGTPFDFCTPPQPEREIGRYYHYKPEDRSFVNCFQERFVMPCPRKSQAAASAAISSKPPPPAPKKKPSASKKCSKPANRHRRKTVTRREPKTGLSPIAPRPTVQSTPTTANRPHMLPPPCTPPVAVLNTSGPLNGNGYGYGCNRRGFVGSLVQVSYGTMNGSIPYNMGYPSMPPNASFGNSNGNSMHPGTMPQGQLHSVQNHSNGQSINNVGINRTPTPINGNANGSHGGFINGPNAFASGYLANASRQHGTAFGADFVLSPFEMDLCRQRAREAGTDYFEKHKTSSMGSNPAGLYAPSPSSSPWEHTYNGTLPIRQPIVPPGEVRWVPPVYTSTDSPMGYTTGGFSQPSTPDSSAIGSYPIGSSPMGSMGGASYMTAPNGTPVTHIGSSPTDLASMSRREIDGGRRGSSSMPHMSSSPPGLGSMSRGEVNGSRRGSSSTFLNNPPSANNTDQNDHSYHLSATRRYQQGRRVYSKGKQ